jgi:dipeptidyl aminopeptidase/acylaminoacyl peptidase
VAYQPTEGGAHRLDFPLGTRLCESPGVPLTSIHVSPKGDRVAFALNEPGAAVIAVVDLKGSVRTLYRAARASEADLAWAPDGSLLYTMDGENLVSVDLAGRVRRVHADTTLAAVHHASASGRLLVEREVVRRRSVVRRDGAEADLGWQEFTRLVDLSRDGQWALLDESGGRIGPVGQPLLRRTDGSPPKLLEAGLPLALSPDARHALIRLPGKPARLRLVPTGAGSGRDLALDGWDLLEGTFSPDGLRVFAIGRQGEGPTRILDFPAAGGPGRVLDSPLPRFEELTPDGRDFVALDDRRRILLAPVSGGPAREAPGSLEEGDYLVGWSDRGELRIGHAVDAAKLRVDLLDLATGARRAWTVLAPADTTGAVRIRAAKASRDGRTVAFTTGMVDVSDLLVAEGLR